MKCPNCKKKIEVGARYCNHCAAIFDKPLERPKRKSIFQSKGVHVQMSFKELGYYLFKKKRCPFCGGKMSKFTQRKELASTSVSSYEIKIHYKCEMCNKSYSLRELATGEKEVEVKNIEEKEGKEQSPSADVIVNRVKKIVIFIFVLVFIIHVLSIILFAFYKVSNTF